MEASSHRTLFNSRRSGSFGGRFNKYNGRGEVFLAYLFSMAINSCRRFFNLFKDSGCIVIPLDDIIFYTNLSMPPGPTGAANCNLYAILPPLAFCTGCVK